MQNLDYQSRLDIIIPMIKEAAEIAMHHFGKITGQSKEDGTFVTQADKAVEIKLLEGLRKNFPGETILGEETGLHREESDLVWAVDPIDGTAAYLCRLPMWGVSVGLVQGSRPVMGAVYLPVLQEMYFAAPGIGAFMESPIWGRQKLSLKDADLSQKGGLLMAPSNFYKRFGVAGSFTGKIRSMGSTVANVLLVARGDAEGALARVYEWDLAGCLPVLMEAGGCVDCLDGQTFDISTLSKENKNLPDVIITNPQAREKLLSCVFKK